MAASAKKIRQPLWSKDQRLIVKEELRQFWPGPVWPADGWCVVDVRPTNAPKRNGHEVKLDKAGWYHESWFQVK